MSADKIKNILYNTGLTLKDTTFEALDNLIEIECNKAKNEQKDADIITSIMALSDAGIKELELYDLLNKFWNIENINEAKSYINEGRHIEWPYYRLKMYLKNQGYTGIEIVRYMHENKVREKLANNAKLSDLPDKKLKDKIENISI